MVELTKEQREAIEERHAQDEKDTPRMWPAEALRYALKRAHLAHHDRAALLKALDAAEARAARAEGDRAKIHQSLTIANRAVIDLARRATMAETQSHILADMIPKIVGDPATKAGPEAPA